MIRIPSGRARSLVTALLTSLMLMLSAAAWADVFRFAWPVPVTAVVKAKMQKKGNESTARYAVRIARGNDDEMTLEFRDFKLLTINGKDASDPEVAAQLGPVASLASSLPTMRLSGSGEYLGTSGLETLMDRLLAAMPGEMDGNTRAGLINYYRSPKVQALMQQKSGEMWNVWVGAWNGLELDPGQSLKGTVPVQVMGRDIQQQILIEHLGAAEGYPCCVRLRMTTVVDGPEVLQLVTGMLQDMAAVMDRAGETFDPARFTSARSTNVTEVITRPSSLIPRYASSKAEVSIRLADNSSRTQTDRKWFWFEWD